MEAKSLPAVRLDRPSMKLFAAEAGKALSVRETASLATLTIAEQRNLILGKLSSVAPLITREECDKCLADLSLVVPSSDLSADDMARKLDLHFGIYRLNGVTRDMLRYACMVFAAAPTKGKAKFFPDPGALLEIVADQAKARKQIRMALQRALDVLDGKLKPEPLPEPVSAEERARRREMLGKLFPAREPQRSSLAPIPEGGQPPPIKPPSERAEALDAAMQRHGGSKP